MAKTRANLAQRALEKLMIVGAGQSADAEDLEAVDRVIDAVLADLEGRDIVTVSDLNDIDLADFEWLADILADAVATDFGQASDGSRRDRGERMLKKLGAAKATLEPQVAEYF